MAHTELIVASIVGGSSIAGVWLTVRQARRESTEQHAALLARLDERHGHLEGKVRRMDDDNRRVHQWLIHAIALLSGWARHDGGPELDAPPSPSPDPGGDVH